MEIPVLRLSHMLMSYVALDGLGVKQNILLFLYLNPQSMPLAELRCRVALTVGLLHG